MRTKNFFRATCAPETAYNKGNGVGLFLPTDVQAVSVALNPVRRKTDDVPRFFLCVCCVYRRGFFNSTLV